MPFDPNMLKGLTLNANDIPPEMLEQDSQSKYNELLKKYEGLYNNDTISQDNVKEAIARREGMSTPAALFDLGQGIASAVNQYAGGKGLNVTAGDSIRKRAQQDIDEAKLANKELLEHKAQQMKGAENLLNLYQKDMSDKEKRALDKEQKEINREYLKVQQQQANRADYKSRLENQAIMSERDPNSPKSKAHREFISKKYPEYADLVAGKSFADIEATAKMMMTEKQLSEYQKEQLAMKKEKEASLSDKQVEGINEFDDSINKAKSALGMLENNSNWTGVGDALVPDMLVGSDQVAWRSSVGRMTDAYRKLITGAAAGDKELSRLEGRLPKPSDTYKNFVAKSKSLIEEIEKAKDTHLSNYAKKGKAVEAFRSPSSFSKESNGEVERITKDGQTAIFDAKTKQFLRYK